MTTIGEHDQVGDDERVEDEGGVSA
jgi:hypothetical protein